MRPLTPRQAAFALEYLVDLNGTQAAIRAGYSPRTANEQAARLLAHVSVQAEVQRLMAERAARTEVTADAVLQELWAIGTADPNDLIEYRRRCCRHCWGSDHRRQETPNERTERLAAWSLTVKRDGDDAPIEPFDELGGLGWDPRREPHANCPECRGEGVGDVVVKDSARAPGAARKLYAGVKLTKDGLEVLMHDKVGALVQVGRHLGMFVDRKQVTGAGGGPLETVTRIERVIVRPKSEDPDS